MTPDSTTPVVVFGAGGLAREVAWTANMRDATLRFPDGTETNAHLAGHLDDRSETHGSAINGVPILGGMDWLLEHPNHAVLVGVGKPSIRREIVARLRNVNAVFPTLLAPDTFVGDFTTIGEGAIALPGVVISVNVKIGDFVLLNPLVSLSHDDDIGDYCSLGPGVNLAGNVQVGEETDIGTGASAIPGARIGRQALIGAGACVVREIPSNSVAVGVPARVIRSS